LIIDGVIQDIRCSRFFERDTS